MAGPPHSRRRWLAVGLVALVAVALGGCGGGDGGGERGTPRGAGDGVSTPQRGGQVVVGFTSDMAGVNSLIVNTNLPTQQVLRLVYLQLLREQPTAPDRPPTFEPDLARSYEWSEDHKTVTFHLRENARWSDGQPVTADDVRFTWQAQTSPEVGWDGSSMKEAITDVEVVDPHTVRFHFSRVYSTQLLDIIEDYILPAHLWGKVPFSEWRSRGDWFRDHRLAAGPFQLESWTPQQQIVLAKNPSYYDPELPLLDRMIIRVIPDQASQVNQLLAGDLDVADGLSPDDAPQVEADPRLELASFWARSYIYVGWNLRRPPFADRDVRLALTLGIDRKTIVDSIWGEFAAVGCSPIVAGVWGHDDSLEPHPYDPDRARAILAEKGWIDHDGDGVVDRDGQPFAFELLTNAGNRQRADASVMIQDQLRRIGVRATPSVMEFQSFSARVDDGQFDAIISGWAMPTTLDNRPVFHSAEIADGSNFVAFSDPEMDRVLDQIRATPELTDTLPLLYREQQIVHRELPYTFLWESKRLVGINHRVRDARPNSLYVLFNVPEWWVAPPG